VLQAAGNHGNCEISEAEDFKDDAIQLMTCMINSALADRIYRNAGSQPGEEKGVKYPNNKNTMKSAAIHIFFHQQSHIQLRIRTPLNCEQNLSPPTKIMNKPPSQTSTNWGVGIISQE